MNNKIDRVDSEIKRELSSIITFELKDPRVNSMVTVTGVNTTKDLKTAKVFISVLDESQSADVLEALNNAAGFIRNKLFDRLKIRMVPHLTFIADNSIAHGFKIEKILKGLNNESKGNADE